nr:hypothetical protein BaRGS_033026 [Batillaria attramentaria]
MSTGSVIFHVERHPQHRWFKQCVTFNFFPSNMHELAYNLFNVIALYGLPLIIITASYSLILCEISKKTRQSKSTFTIKFKREFIRCCFCLQQKWSRRRGENSAHRAALLYTHRSTNHRSSESSSSCRNERASSPAVLHDLPDVPPEVLDDKAFMIVEDPADITEDVLDDAVLVPVSICSPDVDAKVLDGAAIVQMLSPKFAKNFQQYVDLIFLPYIQRQFETTSRVDIVWDVYKADSLKASARERRGCGFKRMVVPSAQLPGNWKGFLRDNDNKTQLFEFLAKSLAEKSYDEGKKLVTTIGDKVLCCPTEAKDDLRPCSHEEADTRVILHAADCARSGLHKVLIRTTDTDVLVMAIAHFHKMAATELWIAFGCGKNFRGDFSQED